MYFVSGNVHFVEQTREFPSHARLTYLLQECNNQVFRCKSENYCHYDILLATRLISSI